MSLLKDGVTCGIIVDIGRYFHYLLAWLHLHADAAAAEHITSHDHVLLALLLVLLLLLVDHDHAIALLAGIVSHPEVFDFLIDEEVLGASIILGRAAVSFGGVATAGRFSVVACRAESLLVLEGAAAGANAEEVAVGVVVGDV